MREGVGGEGGWIAGLLVGYVSRVYIEGGLEGNTAQDGALFQVWDAPWLEAQLVLNGR